MEEWLGISRELSVRHWCVVSSTVCAIPGDSWNLSKGLCMDLHRKQVFITVGCNMFCIIVVIIILCPHSANGEKMPRMAYLRACSYSLTAVPHYVYGA